MKTSRPQNVPIQVLARRDRMKEPCPQSWKMMYVRTANPAVGTARASTSRYETSRAKYIATESARYGTTEVARSRRLRPRCDSAYGATSARPNGWLESSPDPG